MDSIFYPVVPLAIHLLIPIVLIYWVGFREADDRLSWLAVTAFGTVFLALYYLGGMHWHWVGWYWPYLFWVLWLGAIGWFLYRQWSDLRWWSSSWTSRIAVIVSVPLGAFVGYHLADAIDGQAVPDETVALEFPLDDGHFYVIHGGSSTAVNHHAAVPARRYAVEIVELNRRGSRSRGLQPDDRGDYEIWGTTVRAPCDGEVVSVERDVPDLAIGQRALEHPRGNHVAIYCTGERDATVMLSHLRQHSSLVDVGDEVRANDMVGGVGNSSFFGDEPHLHISAVAGRSGDMQEELFSGLDGVAMTFDGRFLTRNDRVDRR